MAIKLLSVLEAIRTRLDDFGGDRGTPSTGYYAKWQESDVPALWKNLELVRYLKLAILDISNRAPWREEGLSSDLVGDPTRLAVIANNPEVELEETTLSVEQVRLVSSGLLLTKTESSRLADSFGSETWPDETGTPTHYLEPRRGWLRLFPIPIANDEVRLIVKRRASMDFEWTDVAHEATPTVELDDLPDDLEEALIVATCRYAYQKRDSDTYRPDLVAECAAELVGLVGPLVNQRQRNARRYNANLDTAIRGHAYSSGLNNASADVDSQ